MSSIAELFDLSGKVAVVTGGAMGIGRAITLRLAEAGAAVIIADLDLAAAGKTSDDVCASGGRAVAVQANAGNAADAEKVMEAARANFGGLDVLVNNAGIYPMMPFLDVKDEMLDRTIDLNLKGMFKYSRAAAKAMIQGGRGGRIINVASVDGLHPSLGASHYCSSKGGVVMLTKAAALELAPHGILVNAVAPGSIKTPGSKSCANEFMAAGHNVQDLAIDKKRYPVGRLGAPDDIAKVVLFLASGAADYLCGSVILVDGGFSLS